ncbi:MAG: GerMN domain-containing protein [Oscillospiraceae bacterium]|nr:GerMN domain-containing protein [Oscillospiraceae bacterium]
MKKLPFILLLVLCLCLCACTNEKAVPADTAAEITVYYSDENCENLLSESVSIPELSPENIMAALLEKGAISQSVSVNSFLMDKTGVIRLDLGKEFGGMISAMGTSGEYMMMGALVNTFLDAYSASGLMLQVDGKTLETGHSIYDFTLEYFPLEP